MEKVFEYYKIVNSGERSYWTSGKSTTFKNALKQYERCADFFSPNGTGNIYKVEYFADENGNITTNETEVVSSCWKGYEIYDSSLVNTFSEWLSEFNPNDTFVVKTKG